jgi:hypothetical protein
LTVSGSFSDEFESGRGRPHRLCLPPTARPLPLPLATYGCGVGRSYPMTYGAVKGQVVPACLLVRVHRRRRIPASPRQKDSCGGAGGASSRIAKLRSMGVGRQRACRRRSPASAFTPIPPVSCLAIYWRRGLRGNMSKKGANGGGGVATSRERGGGERALLNVGSKRQTPQLALPARPRALHPPRRCPARTHRDICSRGTRLRPPIPPHRPALIPIPPRNQSRALQPAAPHACVSEVIPETPPHVPPPSRSPGLEGVSTRAVMIEPRGTEKRGDSERPERAKWKKGVGRDERWMGAVSRADGAEDGGDGEDGEAVAGGVMENGRGHRFTPTCLRVHVPRLRCCLPESEYGVQM